MNDPISFTDLLLWLSPLLLVLWLSGLRQVWRAMRLRRA
jgi:hypothetical protein